MRKAFPIISFLMLLCQFCFSGNTIITLENEELFLPNFPFYIDSVIDARLDKKCIGYSQKMDKGPYSPIFFRNDIFSEFKFILAPFSYFNQDKKPVIIKINKIFLYDLNFRSSHSSCIELNLSFLTYDKGKYYEILALGKSKYFSGKKNPERLVSTIEDLITEFVERYKDGKTFRENIDPGDLCKNLLEDKTYPVFTATEMTKGIYWSFNDFRDCTPDTITPFKSYVDIKNDTILKRGKIDILDHSKKKSDLWGYSDGKNVFVDLGYDIYPLEKLDSGFYVKFFAPDFGTATETGAILFGFAGALLFYAIEASTSEKVDYYLDFNSASFKLSSRRDYDNISANNIFYYSKYSRIKDTLHVICNDSLQCTLTPSSYYLLKTPSSVEKFDIKIVSDSVRYEYSVEPSLFNTQLYMINIKKNNRIKIEQLFLDAKKDVLNLIEAEKIHNVCTQVF